MTALRITHVGGPTALIEVGGWRLLTDPTFDPPGRKYAFGWGTGSVKLAGPAIDAPDLEPIDTVLLTHDHHDDNLDPPDGRSSRPPGVVVTTVSGAKRLGGRARGLEAGIRRHSRRTDADRDQGHAVPPRPTLSHPARRRRDRLRPPLERSGARRACGSPTTPFSTTVCARLPTALRSTPRSCISGRAVRYHGTRALHDDGPRRRRGAASSTRAPLFQSTTKAGSTSGRADRRSSASSRGRRRMSAVASSGVEVEIAA